MVSMFNMAFSKKGPRPIRRGRTNTATFCVILVESALTNQWTQMQLTVFTEVEVVLDRRPITGKKAE